MSNTVNIKSILIDGKPVELPERFQQVVENGRTLYSYLHTCFLYIVLPEKVVATLINAILDSGAILVKKTKSEHKHKLSETEIKKIFWENRLILKSKLSIDWGKLPSFSITMFAQNPVTYDNSNSVVTIKLGPRDYLQRYDSKHVRFTVKAGSNDKAALGIPFMTRLGLTFDRQNKRIGFGAVCGCETMTDGYPTISNGDQVLWSLPRLPERPSTSGSDGTFIRKRKPTTTTDQVVVPEKTHHAVNSRKQTLNKLD